MKDYAYQIGKMFALVFEHKGTDITASQVIDVSIRPDRMRTILSHLSLAKLPLPECPAGWVKSPAQTDEFWRGYLSKAGTMPSWPDVELQTVGVTVRLTPAQRDKLTRLGTDWLVRALDGVDEGTGPI